MNAQFVSEMELISSKLLPITIAFIMMGIGINLKWSDFKQVFAAPKGILTGLFAQLLLLPIIAFSLAFIFPLSPVQQLGLILLAACPGGTSSNIVTFMLKGRVALSVSITAFNSFIIIVSIPLYLSLGMKLFFESESNVELSFLNTFSEVLFTVLLPVSAGMFINYFSNYGLTRLKKALVYILPALLFIVFAVVLFTEQNNGDTSFNAYLNLVLPAILLNVVALLVGYYVAKFVGIAHRGRFTIAIEMGLQNSALAIFLAVSVIQIEGLAIIPIIYGGFSFFSTWFIAYLMKRFLK